MIIVYNSNNDNYCICHILPCCAISAPCQALTVAKEFGELIRSPALDEVLFLIFYISKYQKSLAAGKHRQTLVACPLTGSKNRKLRECI